METTLLTGDFVYIALVVIIFGGGSAFAGGRSGLAARLDRIEKALKELKKPSHVVALLNHVTDQVDPQRRKEFKEEFHALLEQYVVEYDEKNAWE